MTDDPFVGQVYLEFGDTGSPVSYTRMCKVTGIGGLGEKNDLVDVTTFCSGGNREYISGLADGQEMTIDALFVVDEQARRDLIAAVKAKSTRAFRVVVDDDNNGVADLTFWFNATCLAWMFNPSVDDKNAIQFTLKISGEVDITEP